MNVLTMLTFYLGDLSLLKVLPCIESLIRALAKARVPEAILEILLHWSVVTNPSFGNLFTSDTFYLVTALQEELHF